MTAISVYDKQRVAHYFGRAAQTYTQHDRLQRQVADQLLARLAPSSKQASIALDVGCGPAHHQSALKRLANHYIGLDLAPGMLARAQVESSQASQLIAADMEQLPLADASVDVLFSNLAMQWGNDFQLLLKEWHRVLAPRAQIAASTVLAGSLQPLGDCFAAIDQRPHTNHWLEFEDFAASVAALPWQVECEKLHVVQEFPSVEAMLRELKGVGANYTVRASSGLVGRERFRRLQETLECHRNNNGMLELHWVIGLMNGKKSNEEIAT